MAAPRPGAGPRGVGGGGLRDRRRRRRIDNDRRGVVDATATAGGGSSGRDVTGRGFGAGATGSGRGGSSAGSRRPAPRCTSRSRAPCGQQRAMRGPPRAVQRAATCSSTVDGEADAAGGGIGDRQWMRARPGGCVLPWLASRVAWLAGQAAATDAGSGGEDQLPVLRDAHPVVPAVVVDDELARAAEELGAGRAAAHGERPGILRARALQRRHAIVSHTQMIIIRIRKVKPPMRSAQAPCRERGMGTGAHFLAGPRVRLTSRQGASAQIGLAPARSKAVKCAVRSHSLSHRACSSTFPTARTSSSALRTGGRPARGDRAPDRRPRRRPRVPDAARRHRLGQDVHDGQRDRAHRTPGAGPRAEQDARGAALRRVPRVLPAQRGRVLRLLLRLLPARGLRAVARPVHREGQLDQRAHRADAAVGDEGDPRAARLRDRGDGVGDLRHRRSVRVPQHDPAREGGRRARPSATRSDGSPKCSTRATRPTSGAARSASAATSSTCSRPSTPRTRCASRCSTTRSSRCSCSIRSPATSGSESARFTVFPSSHYVTGRQKVLDAIEAVKAELVPQKEFFVSQMKLIEAQRIEQRTRFDLEMMTEIGFCKGIENYSRHLSGRKAGEPPPTLIDYLPSRSLMFIDESHVTIPQVGGMYKRRSRAQGEPRQLRLPPAVGAGQPAAALRRVRAPAAADDVHLGDARPTTSRSMRDRSSSRSCGRPGWSIRRSRCGRRRRRSTTCCRRSGCAPTSASACW